MGASTQSTVISTTPGVPNSSSTRVRLEWLDNAIENRWLQIRLLPSAELAASSRDFLHRELER